MNLELTIEERDELCRVLESDLSEMRVETRRTERQDLRETLHHEQALLRGVLARLRNLN